MSFFLTYFSNAGIGFDSTHQEIRNWLNPADPSVNYNSAVEMRDRYQVPHAQTNSWFLQHKTFKSWLEKEIDHLWIYGSSGSGKTVLSSVIIHELSNHCLYFYFDFRDSGKQTLNQLLRSLIIQLYSLNEKSQWILERLWFDHNRGDKQPQTSSLVETFDRMARQTDNVKIVLDALDESIAAPNLRNELLVWL